MNFNNLNLGLENPGEGKSGFVIHNFLAALNDTFNQSNNARFKSYFKKNGDVPKWMVFSDYVLNDKSKPNDVVTFSIIPYTADFFKLSEYIDSISFKDIKKLKRVNEGFINFINSSEILNISVLLPKARKLDPINEREMLKTRYEMAINQVKIWLSNDADNKHYKTLLSNYELLLSEVCKSGANFRYIRDIEIVSSLSAYIVFQICTEVKVEIIGWFSDRDALLSYKAAKFSKPIIFDLTHNLYHNLMFQIDEDYKESFVFGLPERNGKVWYDSYNRIPDLIAATLADYNYENNQCSHDKFIPVIEKILTNKEKNIIYKLSLEDDVFSAGVLDLRLEDKNC
ncbi:hypothetical protein [Vibrio parahaemolyticus]|uniref:hypothetical protein n=1 Tax=Vibrio parahaemolyticus TaxID=670 RepID=UPI0007A069C5|nr:hypothetical protein [Vibrio parahaemolyticus]EGQ7675197.1 hypothetical protein [Vibrio parahaemolyticus]KYZ08630.1 hypothetical protein AW033_21825 [Vibrio parahaemolyticus]MBE3687575.1 hypothetical protein [Vibrio parahaemolyticus]MBE3803620.1 hypothetical protein [Vibrio parahaemolyticus]MBE4227941.1 hypothetical protein [Vibrio parahaemolyticus]